jgi:pyruvate,water dikinase
MFNLGEAIGRTENAVRLQVNVPLVIYALDMGGGLRDGLTTCDTVSVHDATSVPFVALWGGFSYPGINWSSAIGLGGADFLSLMAAGARPQQNTRLGGASYAILAGDYLNLSVRFGYHFATVDALCGEEVEHNYLTLNFAGGAGAYHGRSLRIQFLAGVLDRLGFETTIKGDLLEASLGRLDRPAMEPVLDQVGRLLAASRLLDMALKTPGQVQRLIELFFQGRYDFLEPEEADAPANFHPVTGDWTADGADLDGGILQDGSKFVSSLSVGLTRTLTRLLGQRYQDFLDNIEAYQYFPLLIARESRLAEGTARVRVKLLGGDIDRAGGLAFALRDWANYFVLRIDALDNRVSLLEFRNGKPVVRRQAAADVQTEAWHSLQVDLRDGRITGSLDGTEVCTWQTERTLDGYLGLWTKADSVTLFRDLTIQPTDRPACLLG